MQMHPAVWPVLTSLEESTTLISAAGWGWAAVLCARPQCLWTGWGIDWFPGSPPRPCQCCWHCWCWRWSRMTSKRKGWKWSSPWASRGTGSRLRKGSPSGWCARDAEWWRTVGRNCGHRSDCSSWRGCWTTHLYAVGGEEKQRTMRRGRRGIEMIEDTEKGEEKRTVKERWEKKMWIVERGRWLKLHFFISYYTQTQNYYCHIHCLQQQNVTQPRWKCKAKALCHKPRTGPICNVSPNQKSETDEIYDMGAKWLWGWMD